MKVPFTSFLLFTFHIVFSQHTNVMISNSQAPEEPSIMISTRNPKYIVAGANIRSAYHSSDTGRTWSIQTLSSPLGVWGDPAIICDTNGHFYFFHLSGQPSGPFLDQIVAQKSTDQGASWSSGASIGYNAVKQNDKQWAVVDPRNNTIYTTWTLFDKYQSSNPADSSHILFSKSVDGGITWSTALRIDQQGGDSKDSDSTVEGAVPAAGPNGEVYVAWAGPKGLVFNKSLDAGNTWSNEKVISNLPGGWNFDIPGIYRANGLPITVCDVSNSSRRGTIYVNWSDQRNGSNDTDVWLVKSTDGGNTWGTPVRVNNDVAGKQQFFTWMTIDQSNGYLYFVFYDRRNYADNRTDVYMARSTDGGNSFHNFKISESPFAPTSNVFFGDYTNLSAQNGIIRPVWSRLDNGQLSVWTALIDTAAILNIPTGTVTIDANAEKVITYPNPFTNNSFLSFKLRRSGIVSVDIYDITGKIIARPIYQRHYPAGKYIEKIDTKLLHIAAGTYVYRITINRELYVQKVIRLE